MRAPRPVAERFWAKVDRSGGPDACWLWMASLDGHGYGQFVVARSRMRRAHRVAYELVKGPIPAGFFVCHDCPGGDNPRCVDPAHLWLGAHRDNTEDGVAKGQFASGSRHGMRTHPERRARGERQGAAKLTADAVRAIREEYARGGVTQEHLAETFGVSRRAVGKAVRGETGTRV